MKDSAPSTHFLPDPSKRLTRGDLPQDLERGLVASER
jgi:hypothetical protein